jgi:ring-1,2-phenylacetyl-CoA epoxidase subunit PaaE
VYGNKTPEDVIFSKELHDLQLQHVGRFYSQCFAVKARTPGRIEKSTVNYVMNNKHKELEFDKFYLCGPETMIEVVTDVLKRKRKGIGYKI